MLVQIQAVQLLMVTDSQAHGLVEDGEDEEGHDGHEGEDGADAYQLGGQAAAFAEDAGEYGSKETAAAVDTDGAYRVVDSQFFVNEFDGQDYHDTGDGAD